MMTTRSVVMATALMLAVSTPVLAGKKTGANEGPGGVVTEVQTMTATVTAIDHKTRKVTLTGPEGNSVTLTVGPEAKNLGQVKKGDLVTIDKVESVALIVTPKGQEAPSAGVTTYVEAAKPGEQPRGMMVQTVQVTATVEAIDYKARTVTLRGPEGNVRTLKVGPEAKHFGQVKKGDQVTANLTEATAISVTKPQKK